MSSLIHPMAIVHSNATLGKNVQIDPFAVIEGGVTIGDNCRVHSHAAIKRGTIIGENCDIHYGAVIGDDPQDVKFTGEETSVLIGNNVLIREYVTIHKGTTKRQKTVIGNNCFLMAYSHVGHDCIVEDDVILVNAAQLGGHVTVEKHAFISGMVVVHQFCRIGQNSIVGGGYRVVQDVPPFIIASGEPLRFSGINVIGLRRRNFSSETRLLIKQAYSCIYQSELNTSQALEKITAEFQQTDEIKAIVSFIMGSERGII